MKKKFTAEQIEAAAWAAALQAEVVTDKVPPGWLTTAQLAAKLGKSRKRVGEMLRAAVASGRCEKKDFRVAAAGSARPVPHYKLK